MIWFKLGESLLPLPLEHPMSTSKHTVQENKRIWNIFLQLNPNGIKKIVIHIYKKAHQVWNQLSSSYSLTVLFPKSTGPKISFRINQVYESNRNTHIILLDVLQLDCYFTSTSPRKWDNALSVIKKKKGSTVLRRLNRDLLYMYTYYLHQ